MRSGQYDRLIKILAPQSTIDAEGDEQLEWCTLDTRWANKRESSGREQLSDPQIEAQTGAVFTTRYMLKPVNTSMRVEECGGRLWDIVGLSETTKGRRREHEIACRIVDKLGSVHWL